MHTAEVVQLKVGHDSHVFSDQVRVSISMARLLREGGGGEGGEGEIKPVARLLCTCTL